MIDFKESNITDITPEHFKHNPKVQALGYALSNANKKLIAYCENVGVYAVIDNLPEDILDALALDTNTPYYDVSLDIESKRRLIKGTFLWYAHAGTPSAVTELVAAVFGEGEVQEWFEYGGEPHYFKIITNARLTPDINDEFSKILKNVKSVSAHIEAIEITRKLNQSVYAAGYFNSIHRPPAVNSADTSIVQSKPYIGVVINSYQKPAAIVQSEQ